MSVSQSHIENLGSGEDVCELVWEERRSEGGNGRGKGASISHQLFLLSMLYICFSVQVMHHNKMCFVLISQKCMID